MTAKSHEQIFEKPQVDHSYHQYQKVSNVNR